MRSAKSNDITNIFVKTILVQKIAFTSIYDNTMSPEHFEIKKQQKFASLVTVKNRQLSTVPLIFDYSRGLAVNGKFDYRRGSAVKVIYRHRNMIEHEQFSEFLSHICYPSCFMFCHGAK